jgi:hypothetical protein
MTPINDIVRALAALGNSFQSPQQELEAVIHRASVHNPWFTKDNIHISLESISKQFLNEESLHNWIGEYAIPVLSPKKIGIVMAGNIPLVGFHDFLAVLLSGHNVQMKLSEKSPYLVPWVVKQLVTFLPALQKRISIVTRLKDFDAVIATGSDNSARYFKQYFGNYPHIIRKNRNAVAVLDGKESVEQLKMLAKDIFIYFGLGCRNVSKLYLPFGYKFDNFVVGVDHYKHLANHNKYKNNIDYNAAVNILNKVPNISLPHLMLIENQEITSRIGCLHYSYYSDLESLSLELHSNKDRIQCVVSNSQIKSQEVPIIGFGASQNPTLSDYADGIDTMEFLSKI